MVTSPGEWGDGHGPALYRYGIAEHAKPFSLFSLLAESDIFLSGQMCFCAFLSEGFNTNGIMMKHEMLLFYHPRAFFACCQVIPL
jgi:hypothetical protein